MTRLEAHVTLRLEAMRYVQDLFPDAGQMETHSGWKPVLTREFVDVVTAEDVKRFVESAKEILKRDDGDRFVDFDSAAVSAALMTRYRCTLDDCMLGFILKTRTALVPKGGRSFVARGFSAAWRGFKGVYNGILDALRIG